jgi:hypothetical protein
MQDRILATLCVELRPKDSQLVGRCPIKDYSRLDYWEFPDIDACIDVKKEIQNLRKTYWYLSPEEVGTKTQSKIAELRKNNLATREKFRNLLKGFESNLAFPKPSNLSSNEVAMLIFKKVQFTSNDEGELGKTNLRKIAWFIRKVANLALEHNHENITIDDIQDTEL